MYWKYIGNVSGMYRVYRKCIGTNIKCIAHVSGISKKCITIQNMFDMSNMFGRYKKNIVRINTQNHCDKSTSNTNQK